jgi:aminoglycoside phosphotransferase (APT) family kinase protein
MLSRLIEVLPSLFSQDHPQVLTHGDLSLTNILVDETTFEITGIVDWSLTGVMPLGMELDILFLTTGFMTLHGWHDYACKPILQVRLEQFSDYHFGVTPMGRHLKKFWCRKAE